MLTKASWKKTAIGLAGLFAMAASSPQAQDYPVSEVDADKAAAREQARAELPVSLIHPQASQSTEPVGASIVCLFDVSSSISDVEYDMQLEAMASAIESDDFAHAVFHPAGPGSVAIIVANFSTETNHRIGWIDIRAGEENRLKALAQEIRGLKRINSNLTYQYTALVSAKTYLDANPWPSEKNIVDMITDGKNNEKTTDADGKSVSLTEEDLKEAVNMLATENGATVNALVTTAPNSMAANDLEGWAWENLVTQPMQRGPDGQYVDSGFVKVVATEQSEQSNIGISEVGKAMELAFRQKLILEVAGITLDDLHARMEAEGYEHDETQKPVSMNDAYKAQHVPAMTPALMTP